MLVTVTQMPDQPIAFEESFAELVGHTKANKPDFVLLPEMPFFPWIAYDNDVQSNRWQAAVDAHEEWLPRLSALGAKVVVASKPVLENGNPHNDAFALDSSGKAHFAHRKYYLPNEPGFWEADWYRRAANPAFNAIETEVAKIGLMICSDIWFSEHARAYARQGVQILANPRATEISSVEKWLSGARTASVMSGAFGLSSNRSGKGEGFVWGGVGWVVDPDGEVLARTSDKQPFMTVDIDLAEADKAKETYPRYVKE